MNVDFESAAKRFSFLRVLFKKIIYVIAAAIIAAAAGFLYSSYLVKPTYVASSAVILRMSSDVASSSGKTTTEITLAKYYLPTVTDIAVSPTAIKTANDNYDGAGKISAQAIDIVYGEESLIFSISYTDSSAKAASDKLDVFIKSVSDLLSSENMNLVKAESVTLIPTQNRNTIEVDTGKMKFTLLGAVAGIAIATLVIFVIYKSDNTITNKSEFEEMTGTSVLTTIDKVQ